MDSGSRFRFRCRLGLKPDMVSQSILIWTMHNTTYVAYIYITKCDQDLTKIVDSSNVEDFPTQEAEVGF